MSVIYPLSNRNYNVASYSNVEGTSDEFEKDDNDAIGIQQRLVSDMVDFITNKNDAQFADSFHNFLSDFSRAHGHIYDEQIEKLDKWQFSERHRKQHLCETLVKELLDTKIDVKGNYYDIHDNKIEK